MHIAVFTRTHIHNQKIKFKSLVLYPRLFVCEACGHVEHRDTNASANILEAGRRLSAERDVGPPSRGSPRYPPPHPTRFRLARGNVNPRQAAGPQDETRQAIRA
jgi:transposase